MNLSFILPLLDGMMKDFPVDTLLNNSTGWTLKSEIQTRLYFLSQSPQNMSHSCVFFLLRCY